MSSALGRFLRLSPEVRQALERAQSWGDPLASRLVMLESTILTHGMPFPENLNMAKRVQNIVRERGAVPATVGVISGRVHVGLNDEQLEQLCSPNNPNKLKISRRDFPHALAKGCDGGTTVSGTLTVAEHLGWPPIFVTGGVGGVHRGGENSLDVSADLVEMGRAKTAVLSAGVKSILDIGKTLEFLETHGVCVATLGPTKDFPAFFTAKSGFQAPHHVENIAAAVELIEHHRAFRMASGLLVANPIPDTAAAEGAAIEEAIQAALRTAETLGIAGNDVTPFVLQRVNELTQGMSLKANLALIENNAQVGAQISVGLSEASESKMQQRNAREDNTYSASSKACPDSSPRASKRPVVIGGSIFDLVTKVEQSPIELNGATHLGRVYFGLGGVGRNLADALARFDTNPAFISAVGKDHLGEDILSRNKLLDTSHVSILEDANTAMYNVLLDGSGEAKLGVGDMAIHKRIDPHLIRSKRQLICDEASMVIVDGNLTQEAFDTVLTLCLESTARPAVLFEPTDLHFAHKLLDSGPALASAITYTSPNFGELWTMSHKKSDLSRSAADKDLANFLSRCSELCVSLLKHVEVITVTLGSLGALVVRRGSRRDALPLVNNPTVLKDQPTNVSATFYPVKPREKVVSVSGAGDCFTAGFITAALEGKDQDVAVSAGIQAAQITLGEHRSVPERLSSFVIDWHLPAEGRDISI